MGIIWFISNHIRRKPHRYIDAQKTVSKASNAKKTICEYVEELWGIQGETDMVISELANLGILSPCNEVCEIGPGTGRYLERILRRAKPEKYHIYDTDEGWAKYLEKTYSPQVIRHHADGKTLEGTKNKSCSLVLSFGVFVYLPALHAFEYFNEMMRVCKKGGYIIFDCYLCDSWTLETVQKWRVSGSQYPVLLPKRLILKYFEIRGFQEIKSFQGRNGADFSDYLVFQNILSPHCDAEEKLYLTQKWNF
jgi:ubiquinone/menaquinone biosynthesis C-methylase UbiE